MASLTYRPARPTDVQLYFDWANEPDTRRQSFNSAPITLETHTAWFTRKLADPNALLLVFENEAGEAVGQVRFERNADQVIIGVSIDPRHRGKGLASQLIKQGCAVCFEHWGQRTIYAYIKPNNRASARAFEQSKFVFLHESSKVGEQSLVYHYKG